MKKLGLKHYLILLWAIQFILTGLLFFREPTVLNQTTTVYRTEAAIPGPIGPVGAQGIQGIAGLPGRDGQTVYNPVPVIIQGTPGPKGDKGDSGNNGADGSNGVDGQSPQIRKNPSNGNIEQKYPDDIGWTILIKKCEYQGTC